MIVLEDQSLCQSHFIHKSHGDHFYGKEIGIWADFGLVGSTLANYEQLLRTVFSCFHRQKREKIFLKYIVASTLKSGKK